MLASQRSCRSDTIAISSSIKFDLRLKSLKMRISTIRKFKATQYMKYMINGGSYHAVVAEIQISGTLGSITPYIMPS